MQMKLKVKKGSQAGAVLPVKGPRFLIGRGDECHLKPKTDVISRVHCEIMIDASRVVIRDLKSRNGTYVNDKKIEAETELRAGDTLRVGPLEFEVLLDVVGLTGAKQPAAKSVHEVASRTVKSGSKASAQIDASDSGIIGQWLDEADELTKAMRASDPETWQFKLSETDKLKVVENKDKEGKKEPSSNTTMIVAIPDGKATEETKTGEKLPAKAEEKDDKKAEKKEPGKLPPRPTNQAANSRDAAAQMLKKFFNK